MSNTPPEPAPQGAPPTPPPGEPPIVPSGAPQGEPPIAPQGEPPTDERDESVLPEWARAELANVREIKAALEAAKTPEQFAEATARVAELETALHRERLGRTYNLPGVFADLITGDTDDDRDAHAKALSEAYHKRVTGLGSGGLTPDAPVTPTDPASLAALVSRGRR